ncbi:hypothetical protein [Streptomyces griseosporeus]|uniref:hypothetical protein n=1 Tax=Streptomyces griseosporeus TaxID=1910 RepID=UPI0037008926
MHITLLASAETTNPGEAADLPGCGRLVGVDMAKATQIRPPSGSPGEISEMLLPPCEMDGLGPEQIRGAACVWCATGLTAETAVDLGERRHRSYSTFPRGCRACTRIAANRALQDHAPRCEQCIDDGSQCTTGMALYRMIRDSRLAGGRR